LKTSMYIHVYTPPSKEEIRCMGQAKLLKEFEEYVKYIVKIDDLKPVGIDKIKERLGMLRTELFNRLSEFQSTI